MSSVLIDYRIELNLWITLSILIYAISVNLAWRWRSPRPGRLASWIEKARGWPIAGWLLQSLRFAYYVGLPFCLLLNGDAVEESLRRFLGFGIPLNLLMRGVLLPRIMGLGGLTTSEWFAGVGMGIALGSGAFFLMALGWWYSTRSARTLSWEKVAPPNPGASVEEPATSTPPPLTPAWWIILWEAIYAEMHWAFYRAGPIILLDDDYYAGVFLGFLILSLEWWTNPAWRHSWDTARRKPDVVLRWSIAFAMAIIFLFTRNLLLAIALHWAIEMGYQYLLQPARGALRRF